MTNLPPPKERGIEIFLMEKHRDHLKLVFESGEEYPSQAKLKEIAAKTGIRMKSVNTWFRNQRKSARFRTYREYKQ